MDDKTLNALVSSIWKWHSIANNAGQDHGRKNCALCKVFIEGGCHGCPVAEKAGRAYCHNTPYDTWRDIGPLPSRSRFGDLLAPKQREAAERERAYLVALIPHEHRWVAVGKIADIASRDGLLRIPEGYTP